ncbi:MAG TPA: sensor domain-containing diguanylate cyclase [Candidatus Gastranaerophilales bacterium]|nr:sensor domain-containing diguanylate cyclase [Candidatus Gastranaerophilales bacterium]
MSGVNHDNQLITQVAQLQSELARINKLFEFTSITNAVSDLESLAIQLNSFIVENLNLKNIAFFCENEGFYRIIAHENIECPFSFEFKNENEGIWHVLNEGIPLSLFNENKKRMFLSFIETYDLFELEACVFLPFIFKDKVLAIISLGEKISGEPFTNEDFNYLKNLIKFFAPVINKFKKLKEKETNLIFLQKTLHNISILYNIGQAMNFIDDLKKLIQIILAKAIQTLGAERGSLMLYDPSTEELVVKVVHGLPDKEFEKKINDGQVECTKIKSGEGIAGEAFASRKAIITNLGENDPRFIPSEVSRVQSLICLPLIVKDEPIGVINISNKKEGKFFNHDDLDFMGALANQAAIAISNAQLYELAITDSLTKLYIRRHFDFLIDSEIKRSARYKHSISLLMMDIDNFKMINDTYGHQIGDEMLKRISDVIKATIRKIDMPCRYGGEEFALILPETFKKHAKKISERLRKRISEIVVKTKDNIEVTPTISIGLSEFPTDGDNKENLIKSADDALYFAKKMGKNCVAEYNINGCLLLQKEED